MWARAMKTQECIPVGCVPIGGSNRGDGALQFFQNSSWDWRPILGHPGSTTEVNLNFIENDQNKIANAISMDSQCWQCSPHVRPPIFKVNIIISDACQLTYCSLKGGDRPKKGEHAKEVTFKNR